MHILPRVGLTSTNGIEPFGAWQSLPFVRLILVVTHVLVLKNKLKVYWAGLPAIVFGCPTAGQVYLPQLTSLKRMFACERSRLSASTK